MDARGWSARAGATARRAGATARRAAAWTRRGSALRGGLIAEWRSGHLRLGDLPGAPRLIGAAAVAVIAACCGVAILAGSGIDLPGGVVEVPGGLLAEPAPVGLPLAAAILTCIGLAVAATALVASVLGAGRATARLTLVGIGLLGASLGASMIGTVGLLDSLAEASAEGSLPLGFLAWVAGVGACVGAILLMLVPLGWARRHLGAVTALAAVPFLLPLLPVMAAAGGGLPVTPLAQALYPSFPATLSSASAIVGPIHAYTTAVAFLLLPLGLWQAVTWARASSRQVGARVARHVERRSWLLPALVGAKLSWLALGFAGALPAVLGGRATVWEDLRAEGPVAWGYALPLVAAGVWAVLRWRARRPVREAPAERAAGLTVALFWSVEALVVGLLIVLPLTQLVWREPVVAVPDDVSLAACVADWLPAGGPAAISCIDTWLLGRAPFVQAGVLIGALLLGGVLLRRGRGGVAALFLFILGLWALPRAINVLGTLGPPELPFLGALPDVDAPGLPVMDVLVTLAVGALAVAWHLSAQRRVPPSILALVLVVSSLLAHGDTLLPPGVGLAFFAVALAFPVLYELTLDSDDLNTDRPDRSTRVLRALGIRTAVMTLVAVAVAVDVTELAGSANDLFARLLFALPFTAIVVAVALGATSGGLPGAVPEDGPDVPDAPDGPHAPDPLDTPSVGLARSLRPAGAGIGGVALVLAASAVGGVTQPAVTDAYPTPGDRLGRFAAETARVGAGFSEIAAGPDADGLGLALVDLAETARDRLALDRPDACFEPAWDAFDAFVLDIRELGLLIHAADDPGAGATAADLQALSERLPAVGGRLEAGAGSVDAALVEAEEACRTG